MLVVGGGVIGCAIARALSRRGLDVTVLERGGASAKEAPGETGAASWAAAGILGAQIATREDSPLAQIARASRAIYPRFAADLHAQTGIDIELRPSGVLRPAFDEEELASFEADAAWQPGAGLRVEKLDAATTRAAEPALASDVVGSLFFPDDARVDPPTLLTALRTAVVRAGGVFEPNAEAARVVTRSGRVAAIKLADGREVACDRAVIAAGSWSSLVATDAPSAPRVEPVRGQIVELVGAPGLLRAVIEGADGYLSPRDDGRVLVGSTLEHVGHDRATTATAVHHLLGRAIRMAPELAHASVTRAWSGFRPFNGEALPTIGACEIEGLFFATGHHRNGVLLAPLTAAMIEALVMGEPLPASSVFR